MSDLPEEIICDDDSFEIYLAIPYTVQGHTVEGKSIYKPSYKLAKFKMEHVCPIYD